MKLTDPFGVLEKFGREIAVLQARTQHKWLNRALEYWRRRGFPYPELCHREVQAELAALRRVRPDSVLTGTVLRASTVGLRLANLFHPQMWSIQSHGRSALDCFNDDGALRAVLAKAARFYPHRRCWNPQCVRSVLRFHHRSRVSNFRPAVARVLIQKYSPDGGRVLDFAAGFGGRLLAALTLQRSYLGIDPAPRQAAGLRRMIGELGAMSQGLAAIVSGCAEDILPLLPSESFDLILSSPPYYNTEEYDQSPEQSCHRYATYAEWRERFLRIVIAQGCRVLRQGGYFLLNLKDQPSFALASDAARMFPRSFRAQPPLRLLVPALPQLRVGGRCIYRWEPILVMRKKR